MEQCLINIKRHDTLPGAVQVFILLITV